MKVTSYAQGKWIEKGTQTELHSAVDGRPVATLVESDLDYGAMCRHARMVGGPALRER